MMILPTTGNYTNAGALIYRDLSHPAPRGPCREARAAAPRPPAAPALSADEPF